MAYPLRSVPKSMKTVYSDIMKEYFMFYEETVEEVNECGFCREGSCADLEHRRFLIHLWKIVTWGKSRYPEFVQVEKSFQWKRSVIEIRRKYGARNSIRTEEHHLREGVRALGLQEANQD